MFFFFLLLGRPFDESLAITPRRAICFAFVWLDIREKAPAPPPPPLTTFFR
jgi:hypothetical protein